VAGTNPEYALHLLPGLMGKLLHVMIAIDQKKGLEWMLRDIQSTKILIVKIA
jgi:hypothetical protein